MIVLIALPVLAVVALSHRSVQVYAPSNLLIRCVRAWPPRLTYVGVLVVLAGALLIAMELTSSLVAGGAPGWLNLVVLVLAWDAIKIGWLAVTVLIRRVSLAVRRFVRRPAGQLQTASYS